MSRVGCSTVLKATTAYRQYLKENSHSTIFFLNETQQVKLTIVAKRGKRLLALEALFRLY